MTAVGMSRIVAGCCRSGQCEEAYAGWVMMQAAGLQPDTACLNALLAALREAKQWQHALHVFQAARQAQVAHTSLCSAVDCLACITHTTMATACCIPPFLFFCPDMLLHVLANISTFALSCWLRIIHYMLCSQHMHLSDAVHVICM